MAAAFELAQDNDGVLSRAQLRVIGLTRWDVRREVRSRRRKVHGRQAIALHTGDLDQRGQWRIALIEVGTHAALDGVTALQAAGLKNYQESLVHVSVPRGARPGGYRHDDQQDSLSGRSWPNNSGYHGRSDCQRGAASASRPAPPAAHSGGP